MCELSPWLLLGMFLAGLMHVLLPAGFASRNLHGFWGVIKSVAIGVPLPLCSCGVIPAGIGLKKDGASDGSAVAFLISTPQTGVDSVLVSASFFGTTSLPNRKRICPLSPNRLRTTGNLLPVHGEN